MLDALLFPWDEFLGLVDKVLEVACDPAATPEVKESGLSVLKGVYGRIVASHDEDLRKRVDLALGMKPTSADQPMGLRMLIAWITQTNDPGSVFVLKRTDRLGLKDDQEKAIREYFEGIGYDKIKIWFAPERFGQKNPAMCFVGFDGIPPMLADGSIEIHGKSVNLARFHYDQVANTVSS